MTEEWSPREHFVTPARVQPLLEETKAFVLVTTALLAALLPARNAARVDPVVALRSE